MLKLLDRTFFPASALARGCALCLALLPLITFAAAAQTDLITGVTGAIGGALDEVNSDLYFVDYNAGTLERVALTPACEIAAPNTCARSVVASGFSQPEDVALDVDHDLAYVTTRVDPGTTGSLWRVDLATGVKTLVTFNLGAPQQIVLDVPAGHAYTVGYDAGQLWRIELATGSKSVMVTGLDHPVGLAITADRATAYVTENGTKLRIAEWEIATGTRIDDTLSGLTAPSFLSWTGPTETGLYFTERNPLRRASWVDLPTKTRFDIALGLPAHPSEMVVNQLTGVAYVTTGPKILRLPMAQLPSEPVFLGVGHVPWSDIDATSGYATTAAGYFKQFQDSPFGGTLNIFGNFDNFSAQGGATHYAVEWTHGAVTTTLKRSWSSYEWNPSISRYELKSVAPIAPGSDLYAIPVLPSRWYPPFLMMRWPSSGNGLHHFRIKLYRPGGTGYVEILPGPSSGDLSASFVANNYLTLRVDNTPPIVDLKQIVQLSSPPDAVGVCSIIDTGPNSFQFEVTARDPNGHMLSYSLRALWGKNKSESVFQESQPFPWNGVLNHSVPPIPPATGGWASKCGCAHTFYLRGWKRTINGYNYILRRDSHQSVTIDLLARCS